MLDELQVQARLEHIRDYLWRGGAVELRCEPACVAYVLSAEWDTPVLSPVSTDEGLVAISTPVVEGRWRRARTGYHLWVGIDAHVLTAIAVQAPHLRSYVPFVDRSADEIGDIKTVVRRRKILNHAFGLWRDNCCLIER